MSELIRSCGLDLDCLRIAILSSAHMAQFFVGGMSFDCTGWVALPDDAAGCSSTVDKGWICVMELGIN